MTNKKTKEEAPAFVAEFSGDMPTFVARFSDGVATKMTCYCGQGKLDLQRGIALSRAAYHSRTKKEPPSIVEARFQTKDGEVLCEYDDEAIANEDVA